MAEETANAPDQTSTGTATFAQDEAKPTETTETKVESEVTTDPSETKPETQTDKPNEATETKVEDKPKEGEETQQAGKKEGEEIVYNIKLPEGALVDQARLDEIVKMGRENKIPEQQLKDLLSVEHAAIARFNEQQAVKVQKERAGWVDTLKSDPDFGGDKLTETLSLRDKALNYSADQAFIKELRDQGLDNYPPLVKAFAKIGREMETRKWHNPDNVNSKPKTYEEIFYPKQ